jgi:hypothetical protein
LDTGVALFEIVLTQVSQVGLSENHDQAYHNLPRALLEYETIDHIQYLIWSVALGYDRVDYALVLLHEAWEYHLFWDCFFEQESLSKVKGVLIDSYKEYRNIL